MPTRFFARSPPTATRLRASTPYRSSRDLLHENAQTLGAHRLRTGLAIDRIVDDAGAAYQIFEGNIADLRQMAAVHGVVAIVAQYEKMRRRHSVDWRAVAGAVLRNVEGRVGGAARQGLAPTLGPHGLRLSIDLV